MYAFLKYYNCLLESKHPFPDNYLLIFLKKYKLQNLVKNNMQIKNKNHTYALEKWKKQQTSINCQLILCVLNED